MAKTLFALFFLTLSLRAEAPTLKNMEKFPRSLAKDFYIWFYLKQNITSKQADELLAQASHVSKKLYEAYARKSNNKHVKESLRCMSLKASQLLKEKDPSCILLSITPSKASKLSLKQRNKVIKKIAKLSPSTARWMKSINSNKGKINLKEHPEDYLLLFLKSSHAYRRQHFNYKLDDEFLNALSKLPKFDKFIETVAISNKLSKLQSSFLFVETSNKFSSSARFNIGLIKIKQNQDFLALNDFMYVSKNDYFQINRDKGLFWSYLVTDNPYYLNKLYVSHDLNIYTLYAAELLGKEFIGGFKPKLPRKVTSLYDESDPFTWTQLVVKDRNMNAAQACSELPYYENDKMQALYAFYLEKCGQYTVHPFVTPYVDQFDKSTPEQKALFYAIGRQESRLVAGGISPVFAMGMMQIMPFLSKAIAKQKKEKLYLPDMFKADKNIDYAKHHLRQLTRKLKHPLFIAYAYNGGQGYLRRQIKSGLFKKRKKLSKYEPYMSMETLSYPETREYGKKVLANYIVYSKIFNKPTAVKHLFDTLIK
jgi:soluble lytic murein transglycosylase